MALPAGHLGAGVALALCHFGHDSGQLCPKGVQLGSMQLAAVQELAALAHAHVLDAAVAGAAGEECADTAHPLGNKLGRGSQHSALAAPHCLIACSTCCSSLAGSGCLAGPAQHHAHSS